MFGVSLLFFGFFYLSRKSIKKVCVMSHDHDGPPVWKLTQPLPGCGGASGNYALDSNGANSRGQSTSCASSSWWQLALHSGAQLRLVCRGAKTHTEIGWQREGEAEVSKNRSGNRSSCFPQQWNVLCFMEWCGRNSFRVWTPMQFCFDSICKEVSDLYPTLFLETQRYLIICLWCILD